MTTGTINPIDTLIPMIAQAVEEWKAKNTAAHIAVTVKSQLDKEAKQVTLKLLGFDTRYGDSWQLDHCNGRSGNSTAGDYLKNAHGEAIKDWLKAFVPPVLTDDEREKLENHCRVVYINSLTDVALRVAKDKAANAAKELVERIVESNQIAGHMEILKLIGAHPNNEGTL